MGLVEDKMAVLQWGVVIGVSLGAAIIDVRTRRIPNAITIPLLIMGLIQAMYINGIAGLVDAAGACMLLALPFVIAFLIGNGAAGDAKLMGAIGAWLGLTQGVVALICVVMTGIILAIVKAVLHKRLRPVLNNIIVGLYTFVLVLISSSYRTAVRRTLAEDECVDRGDDVTLPYGVAISAGVCVAGGLVSLW